MNKKIPHIKIPHIIALAAITGLLAIAGNSVHAQTTDALDQSEFPQVMAQPVDQAVSVGSNVVLSVQATNADGYQWLRNGVPIEGQTDSSLTIANVGTNDVGLYSCEVSKDGETVPTRTATLNVVAAAATSGGPITVFGTPYPGGGSQGSCPGPYAGYVNYIKTASQGWGWAPVSGMAHTASDGSGRTDTKIEYGGRSGDEGCHQTSVSIPNPTFSTKYRFTIYFPNNVPTGPYPIILTGFNP